MGVLGGFLHLEQVGFFRNVPASVTLGYEASRFLDGVGRYPDGVGSHVGYESHRPLASKLHSLVELLGDGHRPFHREPDLFRRVLLKSAGYERGKRPSAPLLFLHGPDDEILSRKGVENPLRLLLVLYLGLLSPEAVKGGRELFFFGIFLSFEKSVERPVFRGFELLYLPLSLHHELESDALHPPRAYSLLYGLPQNGTHLVSHYPVENPPRLLGLEAVPVDLDRAAHRLPHARFGDLVYEHPVDPVPQVEPVGDVPRYRLPFPVGVGGEVYPLGAPRRLAQVVQILGLALYDGVVRDEAVFYVDSQASAGKIHEVARGRFHPEIGAEVLPYGLRLGRRLYYD